MKAYDLSIINAFIIGPLSPDSDHKPLYIDLAISHPTSKCNRVKRERKCIIRPCYNKANLYATELENHVTKLSLCDDINTNWEQLKEVMLEVGYHYFKAHVGGEKILSFPCNSWFDEECKTFLKAFKLANGKKEKDIAWHQYRRVVRRKKRQYNQMQERKKANMFRLKPKLAWGQLKGKKVDVKGDFTNKEMQEYVQKLYMHDGIAPMVENIDVPTVTCVNLEDVNKGTKKMASGKVADVTSLTSELFKWTGPHTRYWIATLIDQAIKQGFPKDWLMNWIKPIYKAGDKNVVSNYRTIMVSSTIAKLYSTIMEQKISAWAESHNIRALGQAGFRPKHSTVDHLVTLRVIMEESRLQGKTLYCCFVDFKKAFDTVPRSELWNRMVEIGMPSEYRVAVARLYEEIRCQLETENGFSEYFLSNMVVKQGCSLSPTLFGLCIDKLEELVNRVAKEEKLDAPKLMHQVILLLLYADDVVLFSYDIESMQRLLGVLETFCESSGLTVNVEKTKMMVVRTKQPQQYPTLMYKGEPIQCVQSFKYLGIDIPATNRWSGCFESRLQAGWKSYYMLEN